MRVSLPLTLSVSLALHVGLATGIALSLMTDASKSIATTYRPDEPPVILLRSNDTPILKSRQLTALPSAQTKTIAKPLALPSPAQPIAEKALAPVSEPPALALEANPNAHVRALVPESILSPSPAPRLNSAEGVVFILDISGSMYEPFAGSTRIAFARQNLSRQIRALKDGTPFAVTLYALRACNSGPLVAANAATREAAVRFIQRDVDCGGGTNLPAGLASAQQLHPGALVVVSDGDLNISAYKLAARVRDILGPDGQCPTLTIVGIAPRENQCADRLLQGLADEQGGSYWAEHIDGNADLVTSAANIIKPASATP